jgi:hypothetical protein
MSEVIRLQNPEAFEVLSCWEILRDRRPNSSAAVAPTILARYAIEHSNLDSPPVHAGGSFLYSATTANSFDHAVKRCVLAIDWIVRIAQVLLVGHLIDPRLAVADWRRQQSAVRVRRLKRWRG